VVTYACTDVNTVLNIVYFISYKYNTALGHTLIQLVILHVEYSDITLLCPLLVIFNTEIWVNQKFHIWRETVTDGGRPKMTNQLCQSSLAITTRCQSLTPHLAVTW